MAVFLCLFRNNGMKTFSIAMVVFGLAVCGVVVGAGEEAPPERPAAAASATFQTDEQKIGYAIGLQIGSRLNGVDVDAAALAAGVRDGAAGAKPQLTEKELGSANFSGATTYSGPTTLIIESVMRVLTHNPWSAPEKLADPLENQRSPRFDSHRRGL